MTKEGFKELLSKEGYPYRLEGDQIIIDYLYSIEISSPIDIPSGTVFTNSGSVWLSDVKSIDESVIFSNSGHIDLFRKFNENSSIVTRIFSTKPSFSRVGNIGNIEYTTDRYINGKRLLNLMIKRGIYK